MKEIPELEDFRLYDGMGVPKPDYAVLAAINALNAHVRELEERMGRQEMHDHEIMDSGKWTAFPNYAAHTTPAPARKSETSDQSAEPPKQGEALED